MNHKQRFADAKRFIPGGVNSPVRAYQAVGGDPPFIRAAQGAYLEDEDGRRYIDYVGSWGAMILGHAHPRVVAAVTSAAADGLSFGAPTVAETRMAEYLCTHLPWVEKVRMVNSGTEAAMSAIRLARGATGRDLIVKFEGCYHGHADALLVKAGSGALTFGVPTSPGIPAATAHLTLTARFNDLPSVAALFARAGTDIAAVIIEPVAGNMNCVPPGAGFLEGVRALCDSAGSVLIMDEVMSGFRVGHRGAQGRYGVHGDLTVLGKIIGGGMPVGALGGRAGLMDQLAPQGAVYQAGTLSGNPVAMAAGLATLQALEEVDYAALAANTAKLTEGLCAAAAAHGIALSANHAGAMFGVFFTDREVTSFDHVMACDAALFRRFFHGMLAGGIYLAPSPFEAGFVSTAHGDDEIERTLATAHQVFARMAEEER